MLERSVISEHITVKPSVCGGQPHIAGHRIRVQDIVILHEEMGYTPPEIVAQYPTITLADVHAALVYYYDHPEEIQQQIAEDDALEAQMRSSIPSKLS